MGLVCILVDIEAVGFPMIFSIGWFFYGFVGLSILCCTELDVDSKSNTGDLRSYSTVLWSVLTSLSFSWLSDIILFE